MGGRFTVPEARVLLAPFIDFLYPPICFLCSNSLHDRTAAICDGCWGRFAPAAPDHPAWRELRSRLVGSGLIEEIEACWLFEKEGPLREALHLLKYRRVRSVGLRMGEDLGRRLLADPLFASADLLVPVPLHPARRRERGYNQSELIAERVAVATGIPVEKSLLVRTGGAVSQTLLGGAMRRSNAAGAFALNVRAASRGCTRSRVVLVDDVMTTGATLTACATLLKEAGAASVMAACAAVAE